MECRWALTHCPAALCSPAPPGAKEWYCSDGLWSFLYTRGGQPWSWKAAGCAGFRCYSPVNWSMKAVNYKVNSSHLVLGSEFVADFRVKTKHCGSSGPGLATPALHLMRPCCLEQAEYSFLERLLISQRNLWYLYHKIQGQVCGRLQSAAVLLNNCAAALRLAFRAVWLSWNSTDCWPPLCAAPVHVPVPGQQAGIRAAPVGQHQPAPGTWGAPLLAVAFPEWVLTIALCLRWPVLVWMRKISASGSHWRAGVCLYQGKRRGCLPPLTTWSPGLWSTASSEASRPTMCTDPSTSSCGRSRGTQT